MIYRIFESIVAFIKWKSNYKSLNWITISSQAIKDNFRLFQIHKPNYTIIPVLKSNAYGHGIRQIAQIINTIPECNLIAVDSYPEYQIVYKYTNKQILIMWESIIENYTLFNLGVAQFAVWTRQAIEALWSLWKPVRMHIFLNTGMNREGVQIADLESLLGTTKKYPKIQVIWIMSHLACADDPDNILNTTQYNRFKDGLKIIRKYGFDPIYIHLEWTGGMMNDIDQDNICTAWRLGLGLYGYSPTYYENPDHHIGKKLKPALDIYSTITSIQHIDGDETVGYSATWSPSSSDYNTSHNTKVATFGFGYREWLDRNLSGMNWKVSAWRERCSVVGRISMNYATIDVTQLKDIDLGSIVHILSSSLLDLNTVYKFATYSKRIPYELVKLDDKIRRRVL